MTDEDGYLLNNRQTEAGEHSSARNVSFAR